jgi:hypothetical protein
VGFGGASHYWFSAAFHAYQSELFPTRCAARRDSRIAGWLSAACTDIDRGGAGEWGAYGVCVAGGGDDFVAGVVTVMGPRRMAWFWRFAVRKTKLEPDVIEDGQAVCPYDGAVLASGIVF